MGIEQRNTQMGAYIVLHLSHKYYWVRYDSLQIMQDILYHKWEDAKMIYQIDLPESLKTIVIQQLHNGITGGHLKLSKRLYPK